MAKWQAAYWGEKGVDIGVAQYSARGRTFRQCLLISTWQRARPSNSNARSRALGHGKVSQRQGSGHGRQGARLAPGSGP